MKVHIDGYDFEARDIQEGILIDPVLPEDFGCTPNDERPASHDRFWHVPFVQVWTDDKGEHVIVRCLDGGAWDRPTMLGHFSTIDDAVRAIRENRLRQGRELEFENAKALGFAMKVERLHVIEGWAWAVDDADHRRLADGIELTRGRAKSVAALAVHSLALIAQRPAGWSARYDGDG